MTPEFIEEQPLAIPAPHREGHDHRIDPYKSLPGAMPEPQGAPPAKRGRGRPRKDDVEAQNRAEAKRKLERYDRYLDALISLQGDTDAALAVAFRLTVDEATERHDELLAEVQHGVPSSSVNEMLKRRDMDQAALLTMLRKWMYSHNPAASLKAIDKISEMQGGGPDTNSFESYVRIAMASD